MKICEFLMYDMTFATAHRTPPPPLTLPPTDLALTGEIIPPAIYFFIHSIGLNVIRPMWLCRPIPKHKITDMSK
jgi:hypothetical protein